MLVDVRTAYFLLGLFYIVLPLTVYFFLKSYNRTSVKLWCYGGVLNGVGVLLISFRPELLMVAPHFITFTLANMFVFSGFLVRVQSLRIDMGKPLSTSALLTPLIAFVFIYQVVLSLYGSSVNVMITGTIGISISIFLLSWTLAEFTRHFAFAKVSYLSRAYFLLGAIMAIKAIMLVAGNDGGNVLTNSPINTALTVVALFTVIYSNVGYVGLFLRRLEKELKAVTLENTDLSQVLDKRNSLIKDLMKIQAFSTVGTYGSTVVHEALQPLTALRFGLENLELYILKNNDDPDVKERLSAVRKPAEKAIGVIENLRNFMVDRNVEVKPVDVRLTLEEVITLLHPRVRTLGVDISIESTISHSAVLADQHQLERVFFNIINNALDAIDKFAIAGDARRILIKLNHVQQKQFVLIKIIDSGPGIPEGEEARIFEWLETKSGGMGIGLSLCRMLVESWQGAISAYSAKPELDGLSGAVFELKLKSAKK
jgi:signal transduction histidine kinase